MILVIFVTIIGISICAGLVRTGLWYLNSYRRLLRSKCFRGPPALPFIGSAHLFLGNTEDIYKKVEEIKSNYQTPFRIWLGPRLYFVVNDAEHIKQIMLTPNTLEKDSIYNMVKPLLRDGVATASVPKWKVHRKALEPLFHRQALESLVQNIASNALKTVEKMGMEEEGREFEVYNYTSRCAFDTILTTTMGVSLNAINNKECSLFDAIESVLDLIIMRITKPWLQADLIFNYTSMGQTYHKDIKYIRDFTMNSIKSMRNEVSEYIESESRKTLVGLLLTPTINDYKFTDEEIVDEIVTIVGTGYETTATLLSQAIFTLANYPEMQDKIYEEISDIYGQSNSESIDITLQDVYRMEYVERFLKETLRIFPSVPNMIRYLAEETKLGEYTFPAGSSMMMDLVTSHRNEKYWPSPLEFNPDRFLPNHPLRPQHPYAYTPFGLGPRNCIGMKHAMILMKVFLATLVSRYVIKTKILRKPTDLELKPGIALKTNDPIMVSLERRFPESN